MKTKYLFVIAVLVASFAVSCQKRESVFEDPSSTRMEKFLDNVQKVISQPENGWYMAYFTEQDKTPGGTIYTIQFDKPAAGQATIYHEDVQPAEGWGDSCTYNLTRDDGPVLTFDTYNVAMHYYSTSSSQYYQSQGGDFEFDILSACADSVVMRGKRSRNIFKMYPLAEEPASYIQKVKDMSQTMTVGLVEAEITGGMVEMSLDLNRRTISIGRKGAAAEEIVDVPYIITPTGFSLYETLDFQGVKFKDFVYDADEMSLTSNGVVFSMIIPEGFMKYNKFLGKYKMTVGATGVGPLNVEIVKDVEGRSFKLKGVNPKYDISLIYNAGQGALNWLSQEVGTTEGGHVIWLCAWAILNGQSGTFTWSPTVGLRSWSDDPEKEDFVIKMIDFGTSPGDVMDSFLMFDLTEYQTDQTVNQNFPSSWYFPGGNYRLNGPITLTKIVED